MSTAPENEHEVMNDVVNNGHSSEVTKKESSLDVAETTSSEQQEMPVDKILPSNEPRNEATEATYPEGGFGWWVVFSSFLVHFVALGWPYSFGVYQDYYVTKEFVGDSPSTLDFIGSLATALTVMTGGLTGQLADRYGYRVICGIGTVTFWAGLFLSAFSDKVWQLFLTQGVLQGIGASLCFFPAVSIPSQWFNKKRGLATGFGVSGAGLGGLVWSVGIRALINVVGRKQSMLIASFINLVLLMLATALMRTRFPSQKQRRRNELDPDAEKFPARPPNSDFKWAIFRDMRFTFLFLSCVINTFGYLTPFFYIPTYAQTIGISPTLAALMVGILNGSSAFGRILLGYVADTFGRINVVFACLFIAGASQLVIWMFAKNLAVLLVFVIVYGFTAGGFISLYPVIIANVSTPDFADHLIRSFSASIASRPSLASCIWPM